MAEQSAAMVVHVLGNDPVVRFAARELKRYLGQMSGSAVALRRARRYDAKAAGCWVGLAADYGVVPAANSGNGADDVVYVEAGRGRAVLSGANGRAALFAVYRYLEELGCCWIRPGADGERVPRLQAPLSKRVALIEVPSARHRCICIEGSCSVGHVKAMVDYAAKRGFNSYFTQFRNSYTFFARWYGVERHCKPIRTPFDSEEALKFQTQVKREALKRGMSLHTVGHGWTCEPFGIKGEEWGARGERVSAAVARNLAQINGKRELWRGVALNTQLCFSQAKVREVVADSVVEYARQHPLEEYLHVWLADGCNNHCECEGCVKAIPSDWYVMMLNRLDEKLTAAGLDTRIVFLAYVDLLWAPQREKIANPDRFVLMFAPITRSYSRSFLASCKGGAQAIAPYERNKLKFPSAPADNLAMLAEWRKGFAGECVDFDYHLWGSSYGDVGQMSLARVIHDDVTALKKMGMDGYISCQYQRVSFPTGITMEAMGRGLWKADESFDEMAERYFRRVFGTHGALVRTYLEEVSAIISKDMLTAPTDVDDKAGIARMRRASRKWGAIKELVDEMAPVIARGTKARDPVLAASWQALQQHAWYALNYIEFQRLAWNGDPAGSKLYDEIAEELDRRLPLLHDMLDTWAIKRYMQHTLWLNGLPFTERVLFPKP